MKPSKLFTLSRLISVTCLAASLLLGACKLNESSLSEDDSDASSSTSSDYGLIMSQTNLTLTEEIDTTANPPTHYTTVTVSLKSKPESTIKVEIDDPTDQVTISPDTLVFTPANYNIDQTITITANDDDINDGASLSYVDFAITMGDSNYRNLPIPSIAINITDLDSPGLHVTQSISDAAGNADSETDTEVSEQGGSDIIMVRLTTEPAGTVYVRLENTQADSDWQIAFNASDYNAYSATLEFDESNWNVDQVITVSALDDLVIDDMSEDQTREIEIHVFGTDPDYSSGSIGTNIMHYAGSAGTAGSGAIPDSTYPELMKVYIKDNDDIVYVDAGISTGNNDGTSWTDAYSDLQTALNNAQEGQEFWVTGGVYTATDSDGFKIVKNGISIYGSFSGNETLLSEANPSARSTILDGGGNNHVIKCISKSTDPINLSGLVLQGGNAADTSNDKGGGIYSYDCNLVLDEITIQNNSATSDGAGMYVYTSNAYLGSQNGPFTNITIDSNSSTGNGGGVYLDSAQITTFDDVIFSNNDALAGGGIYMTDSSAAGTTQTMTVTTATFSNNSATAGNGGGIYFDCMQDTTFDDMIFSNNDALAGGGIYMTDSSQAMAVTSSTFSNNSATAGNGAHISTDSTGTLKVNLTLEGSQFSAGSATNGGSLYFTALATSVIASNTFQVPANAATSNGGAIYLGGIADSSDRVLIAGNSFAPATAGSLTTTATNGGAIAIFADQGTVSLAGNRYEYLQASGNGGAMYLDIDGATFSATNETFDNNSAQFGGAIYSPTLNATKGTVFNFTLTSSDFSNNTASVGSGGAIAFGENISAQSGLDGTADSNATTGSIFIRRSRFENNSANENGGAIDLNAHSTENSRLTFWVFYSRFYANASNENEDDSGGGALNIDTILCSGCTSWVENQDASGFESAYYNVQIKNNEFESNTGGASGGAIRFGANVDVAIERNYFGKNTVFQSWADHEHGGAIAYRPRVGDNDENAPTHRSFKVTDSFFIENYAHEWGGAIFHNFGSRDTGGAQSETIVIARSVFDGNQGRFGGGGAIAFTTGLGGNTDADSRVLVTRSVFRQNTDGSAVAGAIYFREKESGSQGQYEISFNTFLENASGANRNTDNIRFNFKETNNDQIIVNANIGINYDDSNGGFGAENGGGRITFNNNFMPNSTVGAGNGATDNFPQEADFADFRQMPSSAGTGAYGIPMFIYPFNFRTGLSSLNSTPGLTDIDVLGQDVDFTVDQLPGAIKSPDENLGLAGGPVYNFSDAAMVYKALTSKGDRSDSSFTLSTYASDPLFINFSIAEASGGTAYGATASDGTGNIKITLSENCLRRHFELFRLSYDRSNTNYPGWASNLLITDQNKTYSCPSLQAAQTSYTTSEVTNGSTLKLYFTLDKAPTAVQTHGNPGAVYLEGPTDSSGNTGTNKANWHIEPVSVGGSTDLLYEDSTKVYLNIDPGFSVYPGAYEIEFQTTQNLSSSGTYTFDLIDEATGHSMHSLTLNVQ